MRRRTWVLVGAGAVALLLVGGGVGAMAVLMAGDAAAGDEPLDEGGLSGFVSGAPIQREDLHFAPDGPDSLVTVTYVDGAVITYGFDVRNRGPRGLRITSVDLGPGPGMYVQLITPFHARMEPRIGPHGGAQGGTTDSETVPFQPFDLGPGQDRWVVIRARLGGCEGWSTGMGLTIHSQGFHYSVLGMDHHAQVMRRDFIRIASPAAADCPRPRTVREAPTPTP